METTPHNAANAALPHTGNYSFRPLTSQHAGRRAAEAAASDATAVADADLAVSGEKA